MKKFITALPLFCVCACSANWDVEQVAEMSDEGNKFDKSLKHEYVELAIVERSRGDWDEVDRLLTKAIESSEGNLVGVESPNYDLLSGEGKAELQMAYDKLQNQFRNGARDKKPVVLAQAQIGYECMTNAYKWNIEADIVSCKNYYYEAMDELEGIVKAEEAETETEKVVAVTKIKKENIPLSLKSAYAKDGKPYMKDNGQYLIYYAFNSAEPAQGIDGFFKDIVDEYNVIKPNKVEVSGYTDTAGSSRINQALSMRRAKTVSNGLIKAGIEKTKIETRGYGETALAVPTADSVVEPKNRRTVIEFKE